jgi:hypothetical protein
LSAPADRGIGGIRVQMNALSSTVRDVRNADLAEKRGFWTSERQVGATSPCGRRTFLARTTIPASPSESKV